MKKISYISYLCLFYFYIAALFSAEAQTYYDIPDTNLRNALIKNYPTVMNSNGQLDIDAAKGLGQSLDLDNLNISNADGLQFFESAGILRLRNNNLSEIPQLSFMKNLRRVYLNDNNLTTIPDLSALYKIIDLIVTNNKLSDITAIEGLSTLLNVTCPGNNIISLPNMSALVNLEWLNVSNNPISSLPDLSLNTKIYMLNVSNTNINSIPSLPYLINLKTLVCENNSFTDLSLLNSNTKLTTLNAQNNLLNSLPDFSNKPDLISVDIANNNLTFEDFIPLTTLPTFSAFKYAPQAELTLPLQTNVREPNNFEYQILIDNGITSNQFTWYKNNTQLISSNSNTYSFTPVLMSDSGYYYVEVKNNNVPGLILKSNVGQLNIKPCIEISTIQVSILSSDCREGSTLDVNGTTIMGASLPIIYTLQPISSSNYLQANSNTQFNKIAPGLYILNVTDSRNCSASKSFMLNKNADCQDVFSPNGDGIMDTYFISDTGTAQIYNTSRKLIKNITVPGEWDGTTDNGNLADAGFYVIIVNGTKTIDVSLFR